MSNAGLSGGGDLSGLVPYTGATSAVDLNGQDLNNFANGYNTGSFTFLNGGVIVNNNGSTTTGAIESFAGGSYVAAGYFSDGSNSIIFCNGTDAINATGNIYTGNNITCNTFQATYSGYFGGSHTVALGDDGIKAAGFGDGTNTVEICNGNPLTVNGSVGYTGALNDSTSTQIADVVGGIITAVYF